MPSHPFNVNSFSSSLFTLFLSSDIASSQAGDLLLLNFFDIASTSAVRSFSSIFGETELALPDPPPLVCQCSSGLLIIFIIFSSISVTGSLDVRERLTNVPAAYSLYSRSSSAPFPAPDSKPPEKSFPVSIMLFRSGHLAVYPKSSRARALKQDFNN